jgi:hypothetical protein
MKQPAEIRYWLQKQAPDGGWYDSIGLHPEATEAYAIRELVDFQLYHQQHCRLIRREDYVVLHISQPNINV